MRCLLVYVGSISAFGFHHAIVRPFDRRKFITSQFCSSDNLIVLRPPSPDFSVINQVTPADVINGTTQGSIITHFYRVPMDGFTSSALPNLFSIDDVTRLRLLSQNVTLPVALMLLDPEKYPTQSRARKVIRQKSICISRCCSNYSNNETLGFNELGKVIARIYPGDIIGFQRRAGSDYSAIEGVPYRQPPFEVVIVFEDDHMAIVNKPAGVVVYRAEGGRGGGARAGGQGRETLLSALSHVLKPSNFTCADDDDENVPLKRPQPVHRLDRPTSGLMVIAKTKAAATYLAQQFEYRKAKKSYVAIVNGSPICNTDSVEGSSEWNTIDYDLEEKEAITQWRIIEKGRSLRGTEGHITLLELKPKTGRYHQLRRHMAWICKTPIIGDTTYIDDSDPSAQVIDNDDDMPPTYFRHRGLFLCSNQIEIAHPYYNTPAGRKQWIDMDRRMQIHGGAMIWEDDTGVVMIKATIKIPDKFRTFMERENTRAIKFMDDCSLV
jgi:23S rRNA-/tRNA-specific pseudouridylate synthase